MKNTTSLFILALLLVGCSNVKNNEGPSEELIALRTELDSLKNAKAEIPMDSKGQISTFLTFQDNNSEEAMNFYISLFENSKITHVEKYGKDGPGKEGTVFFATFEINGSQFACSDSPMKHEWTFTPGVSIFVECKSDAEIQNLFTKLSENGKVLMPLNNYGWSTKFGFIEDRFGVSWQLNLE
ncbi:VOC family protein [Aureisphaera galaxeae]|uniref:VOC family protein n=1 Tax=Aureisphaera galaxeae TaxID=1538023 RepID=UPI002350EA92|nr:VOC family protein [Aureisphaera galaxeae]MDC8003885.1 VOC family protein [Aureisphaera galaxeae]